MSTSAALPTPKLPTELPKRTQTHVIDTAAVRQLMAELPPDLVIRSMEDRDYGIDLQVELFDGLQPTGNFAFIQVKGRQAAFPKQVTFRLHVKTILYAQLFNAPFFLLYTSLDGKSSRFVWLQKYADIALNTEDANWRSLKKVAIKFPDENVFPAGLAKFQEIMCAQTRHRAALEFLKIDANLLRWMEGAAGALQTTEPSAIAFCLDEVRRMGGVLGPFIGDQEMVDFLLKQAAPLQAVLERRLVDPQSASGQHDMDVWLAVKDAFDTLKMEYMQSDAGERALFKLSQVGKAGKKRAAKHTWKMPY